MKIRYFWCLLAVMLSFVMLGGLLVACIAPATPTPVEVDPQAVGGRLLAPCLSHCAFEAVDADKWVILVDLSDNVNFPHYKTNRIILKNLHWAGDLSAAMHWHHSVGVVTAVTTATTSIEWVTEGARNRLAQFSERWWPPEHGLSLEVRNATLENVATNSVTATGLITSGTYLSTCRVISGTLPGVGDLILFLNEISDTATIDFFMDVGYDAE